MWRIALGMLLIPTLVEAGDRFLAVNETTEVSSKSRETAFLGVEKLADKWSEEAANIKEHLSFFKGERLASEIATVNTLEKCSHDLLGVLHPKEDHMVQHDLSGVGPPTQSRPNPYPSPYIDPSKLPQPVQSPTQAPVKLTQACGTTCTVPTGQPVQGVYSGGTGWFGGNGIFPRVREWRQSRRASRGGPFGGC